MEVTNGILGAFLTLYPLEQTIEFPVPALFPSCTDRKAWEGLSSEKKEEIDRLYAQYEREAFPVLRASDYMAFVHRKDRQSMERPYFLRRKKLMAVLLHYGLHRNELDAVSLGDMIWSICEESTWVLSAHNNGHPLPDPFDPVLDLFAAQTGMLLSLSLLLTREDPDALCSQIRERAEEEIWKRVIRLFENRNDFWWTGFTARKDLNNWTPWIVSNVMLCACVCVRDKQRLCSLLTRACLMLDRYIDFMPADGGCDEGAAYWNVAGGSLMDALELLSQVTRGRASFWKNPKIKALLTYPAGVWLGGRYFVNFADCDARPYLSSERLRTAGRMTGNTAMIALGCNMDIGLQAGFSDTPQLWRLLNYLFEPSADEPDEAVPCRDLYMPDLMLRIREAGGMTLVCKGGTNHESHNHNDVGSFMVFAGEDPQIVDAGNMTYSGLTFSDQRYTLWNTRSRNHNVPLIGQTEQEAGENRGAKEVRCLEDGLEADLAGAYPEGTALLVKRTLRNTGEGILIRDKIVLPREESVTYVFLLRYVPRITPGCVMTGGIRIKADPRMTVNSEEIPVNDPRMANSWPGSLYRLTFVTEKSLEREDTFEITLNR